MPETICAIATAPGGAIGIVRISGPEAIGITDQIFTPIGKSPIPLTKRKPYTLTFGSIRDENGETVDEVLISLFKAPHSYTGEDSVEISCHGSSYILQRVMQLLIQKGCQAARPGEFTQRAFLNGKMDLSQAEAVADLIASSSAASHRMAINQMRGGFSRELAALRDKLLRLTSLMELELDFSDHEDLEFANRSELSRLSTDIEIVIKQLVESFSIGNAIKNGVPVAIVGETNAGKSTLLNTLLNEEKAIVSDKHGTTRDIIEDTVILEGILFRFIDTAGIRETHDDIECMGITRSFQKLDQAEIVLWVVDSQNAAAQLCRLSKQILPRCHDKHLVVVLNKTDLCPIADVTALPLPDSALILPISAKENIGIKRLKELLIQTVSQPTINTKNIIVTNLRHYEALSHALESIRRVQDGLKNNIPNDLVSEDLRECLFHLGEITGNGITTDEVLINIFSNFCVGK